MNDPVLTLFIFAVFITAGIASMFIGALFRWLLNKFNWRDDDNWRNDERL